MAILAAHQCGISYNRLFSQIVKIKSVPGRLEQIVRLKNNSNIVIDFAHTPEALENSLIALKNQFKRKILLVFGCGGDRDKKKRLIMGKIAKKYCKEVFVTDDNPRNENPAKIRNEIIKGCKEKSTNIGDRKKAIRQLAMLASKINVDIDQERYNSQYGDTHRAIMKVLKRVM